MKTNLKQIEKIKGEVRAERQRKDRFAPKGGGFGAAAARAKVNRNYQGVPKEELGKIHVKIERKLRKK